MRQKYYIVVLFTRVAWVLLIMLSFVLMYLNKAENPFIRKLNFLMASTTYRVMDVITTPVNNLIGAVIDSAATIRTLHNELDRLQNENKVLRLNELNHQQLLEENRRLNQLVKMTQSIPYNMVTARAYLTTRLSSNATYIISAGSSDGIKRRNGVIAEGVVGQIIEVGKNNARMLPLTASTSRVAGLATRSGQQIIIAGDNTPNPTIAYFSSDGELISGENIVTSGVESNFPPYLPIGATYKDKQGQWRVKLKTPITNINQVRIVITPFNDLLEEEGI